MIAILSGRGAGTTTLAVALAFAAVPPETADAADAGGTAAPQDVSSSEITVMGERGQDYKVDQLTTATRTGTNILDVPQSIQVVPRDVIDDQQALDLTSALRNVSGVQAGTNAGNRSESFTIRGFRSSYYAIDSIMLSPAIETNDSYRDMANIERIEVLKGPASVLYGRGDPGGLINIVTKQPKFERAINFSIQAGSNDFVRGQIDVTGSIDVAKTLAVRVIAAAQTGDTFRDVFQPYRRQLFGYEAGATMDHDHLAPARRVFIGMENNSFARMTDTGHALFDAAIGWARAGAQACKVKK